MLRLQNQSLPHATGGLNEMTVFCCPADNVNKQPPEGDSANPLPSLTLFSVVSKLLYLRVKAKDAGVPHSHPLMHLVSEASSFGHQKDSF